MKLAVLSGALLCLDAQGEQSCAFKVVLKKTKERRPICTQPSFFYHLSVTKLGLFNSPYKPLGTTQTPNELFPQTSVIRRDPSHKLLTHPGI